MDLEKLNEEVDKILFDMVGNDYFTQTDFEPIVNSITDILCICYEELDRSTLKNTVQFLIEAKHDKHYIYSTSSELNKVKVLKSKTKSDQDLNYDSDIMSGAELDFGPNDGPVSPYLNSELKSESTDKIQLSCAADLVCHRYLYPHPEFKEDVYLKRAKRLAAIKKIPQFEQKSAEWLDQRNKCLTATAVAVALDEDPYKYPAELLLDKCWRGEKFEDNENTHHGNKYEQVGCLFYGFRNDVGLGEYGLIQNDEYNFIGASPDNICDKYTADSTGLSKLVMRLLEIKFPKTRKILTEGDFDGDICPHQYYIQCQTQMFSLGASECDFLQCQIEEYDTWEEFVKDSVPNIFGLSKKTNLEKGCIIQLSPKNLINSDPKMCLYKSKYLYQPKLHLTLEETEKWIASEIIRFSDNPLSEEYMIDKVICWRLVKVTCNLVKADNEWFMSILPILDQFWKYVLFYRKHPAKLDKLEKFIKSVGKENSDEIFERVNKDYLSVKKNSKFEPLYQETNKWRTKFNNKKKMYTKYAKFNK